MSFPVVEAVRIGLTSGPMRFVARNRVRAPAGLLSYASFCWTHYRRAGRSHRAAGDGANRGLRLRCLAAGAAAGYGAVASVSMITLGFRSALAPARSRNWSRCQ